MIKSITVTNYLGDSLKMELANPERSGFIVESVTGLGPGKANINMTEISTTDGALFNSSRASSRNIVITLRYMESNGESIEQIRNRSYKYFPLKRKVKLIFETDSRMAEIEGYVESNEPTIFSNNEKADVSIICPYPFFYSAEGDGTQETLFSGIAPMFEFPFSNESLTDPLLVLSEIQNKTENVVVYHGDADTGITITIHAVGPASGISIYNTVTRESIHIDTDKIASFTGSGIVVGDDIIICTVPGQKSVTLVRKGVITNILNCMDKNMDWFKLTKGDNTFVYTAETGTQNLQFKIENRLVYEGV